jgi:hypothetical protein
MLFAHRFFVYLIFAVCMAFFVHAAEAVGPEPVYIDNQGVLRWAVDQSEVAIFGANYSLASATDYRAAGYVGADRKKLVEKDLTHFSRMGWDGIRLCFWGDWENCDAAGNLIANDHLDLLDYTIAQAAKRGIHILFTPITTYSSLWPDGVDSEEIKGFSKVFPKQTLGTDPKAIAAQCNYLRQFLQHVNPYTGVALKDEPAILFVEMINEPAHHTDDFAGSVAYINELVEAVRSTGCKKILFHNVSQDFRITPAIKVSQVQGVSFAWYPTGLVARHALTGNYLRSVDDFSPMLRPDLLNLPKIVYEFDSADMNSGYMYPAMVRAFRGVGAQFIAMFSYDMLDTAAYNLGWQTHFLNLVYSPKKAMSTVIAAEATRVLPRYSRWGDYPDNRRFGPFRVSYEEDSSEMVTAEKFFYASDTATIPPDVSALRHVAGVGSSPVVDYEGVGAYFIDQIKPGVWRLEVYPDAVIVQDPFAQKTNHRTVSSRLIARPWPMTLRLPDLGNTFAAFPLNAGNTWAAEARDGSLTIRPGVYLLSKSGRPDSAKLPQKVAGVGLTEFVCPVAPNLPAQIISTRSPELRVGEVALFTADVFDSVAPQKVDLHLRGTGEKEFRVFPMIAKRGYRFETSVPPDQIKGGACEYFYSADTANGSVRFPLDPAAMLQARVVGPADDDVLFSAASDAQRFFYSRIGDAPAHGVSKVFPATADQPAAWRLFLPLNRDATLDDYTASLDIKPRVLSRGQTESSAKALRVLARGSVEKQSVHITLVEADGTSWGTRLVLNTGWKEFSVPIDQFRPVLGVQLPLGYPGRWNYWLPPAKGRAGPGDSLRLAAVERLQISLRPESMTKIADDTWVEISSVALVSGAAADRSR